MRVTHNKEEVSNTKSLSGDHLRVLFKETKEGIPRRHSATNQASPLPPSFSLAAALIPQRHLPVVYFNNITFSRSRSPLLPLLPAVLLTTDVRAGRRRLFLEQLTSLASDAGWPRFAYRPLEGSIVVCACRSLWGWCTVRCANDGEAWGVSE